jgi:inosose dehydratase
MERRGEMSATIHIANAPCSWGVLEFDELDEPLPYDEVLNQIAHTGYAGTELGDWGFMPTDPAELRDELARRHLTLVGAFVPVALAHRGAHAAGIQAAVKTARLLRDAAGSAPFIVLADDNGSVATRTMHAGRITPEEGLRAHQWAIFAAGAERIAQAVREETGLRTVFHHHCAGYVETPAEIDQLMQRTDPALLGLCFDTGHVTYGGGDARATLQRYAERIWHVHFKDYDALVAEQARRNGGDYFEAVRQGVFCELGRGTVDFQGIVADLAQIDYRGWIVVEQDVLPGLGTPAASAGRNRAFIRSLGL